MQHRRVTQRWWVAAVLAATSPAILVACRTSPAIEETELDWSKEPFDEEYSKRGLEPAPAVASRDSDRDQVSDAVDSCPNDPEDHDGFEDADGCPDPDNDGDGVLDRQDQCPDQLETRNGYQDHDGCPDVLPSRAPSPPAPTATTQPGAAPAGATARIPLVSLGIAVASRPGLRQGTVSGRPGLVFERVGATPVEILVEANPNCEREAKAADSMGLSNPFLAYYSRRAFAQVRLPIQYTAGVGHFACGRLNGRLIAVSVYGLEGSPRVDDVDALATLLGEIMSALGQR